MKVDKFKALGVVLLVCLIGALGSRTLGAEKEKEEEQEGQSQSPRMPPFNPPPPPLRSLKEEQIKQYPRNAVLHLRILHKNRIVTQGTGFIIDKYFALTAAHAVYNWKNEEAAEIICRVEGYKGELRVHRVAYPTLYKDSTKAAHTAALKRIIKHNDKAEDQWEAENWHFYREQEDWKKMVSCDYALLYLELQDFEKYEEYCLKINCGLLSPIYVCYYKWNSDLGILKSVGNEEESEEINIFPDYVGADYYVCGYVKNFNLNFLNFYETRLNYQDFHETFSDHVQVPKQEAVTLNRRCEPGMSGGPIRYNLGSNPHHWYAGGILSESSSPTQIPPFTLGCLLTKDKTDLIREWQYRLRHSLSNLNFAEVLELGTENMPPRSSSMSSSSSVIPESLRGTWHSSVINRFSDGLKNLRTPKNEGDS